MSVAIFPLVIYLSGLVTSFSLKKINKLIGRYVSLLLLLLLLLLLFIYLLLLLFIFSVCLFYWTMFCDVRFVSART